jgi:hypothetical protein
VGLIDDSYLSKRLESAKNVGAQSPTKIPNRSPWAGSSPLNKNQMAIEAAIETKPAQKQPALKYLHVPHI